MILSQSRIGNDIFQNRICTAKGEIQRRGQGLKARQIAAHIFVIVSENPLVINGNGFVNKRLLVILTVSIIHLTAVKCKNIMKLSVTSLVDIQIIIIQAWCYIVCCKVRNNIKKSQT